MCCVFWCTCLLTTVRVVGEESVGCSKKSLSTGMTMRNCEVTKWADSKHVKQGTITLEKCTFRVSVSGTSRGGVGRVNEECRLFVSECEFIGCQGVGPSCFDIGCYAEIKDSNFTDNTGPQTGFAGFANSAFEYWNKGFGCLALMRLQYYEGPVWSANCNITNCRFENNLNGGVASARGATLVLTSSFFENNAAEVGNGGDLLIDGGQITVESCTFYNDNACQGRSVYCAGTKIDKYDSNLYITFTDCRFWTNATEGSSIYFFFNCTKHSITMDDCWFCGDCLHFQLDTSNKQLSLKCTDVRFSTTKDKAISSDFGELTGVSYERNCYGSDEPIEPTGDEPTQEVGDTSDVIAPTREEDPGAGSGEGDKNSGLPGGAVAAIVILVLVLVAVALVVLVLYIRKRRYLGSAPTSVEETSEATTTATGADIVGGTYGSGVGLWDDEPN